MKINNFVPVSSKEELVNLLNGYNGILSKPMINYLNLLIELEFSVFKDYISFGERNILSCLEIYQKVAIYNIYNRALKLIENSNNKFVIVDNRNLYEGINIFYEDNNLKLFGFDYGKRFLPFGKDYRSWIESLDIGSVSLYQTVNDPNVIEFKYGEVINILNNLYKEKENDFSSHRDFLGHIDKKWYSNYLLQVSCYENILRKLESKKSLTDNDKKIIDITNNIYNLFMDDYGLRESDFSSNNNYLAYPNGDIRLQKKLTKKLPGIEVKTNIKYI